jgi:hypothetical protein
MRHKQIFNNIDYLNKLSIFSFILSLSGIIYYFLALSPLSIPLYITPLIKAMFGSTHYYRYHYFLTIPDGFEFIAIILAVLVIRKSKFQKIPKKRWAIMAIVLACIAIISQFLFAHFVTRALLNFNF